MIENLVTLPATITSMNARTLDGSVNPVGLATTGWFEWGATTSHGNTTTMTNLGNGTNLLDWAPFTNCVPGTDDWFEIIDPVPTNRPSRYYRLRYP